MTEPELSCFGISPLAGAGYMKEIHLIETADKTGQRKITLRSHDIRAEVGNEILSTPGRICWFKLSLRGMIRTPEFRYDDRKNMTTCITLARRHPLRKYVT